jgi:hypothetical protein
MNQAGTIAAVIARLEFLEKRVTELEAAATVRQGAQHYAQLQLRMAQQAADQFEENKH